MIAKKTLVLLIVTVAILGGAAGYEAVRRRSLFKPEVLVQNEDYRLTRTHFRTRLLRVAGSPQREVVALTRPDYVDEVEYPSGNLSLKAWISGHRNAKEKLPAVIFLHGGFEMGASDWDMAVPYWQAGFVLMMPMLRGENGQAGTFSFLYDEVDDVIAARKFLAHQPSVDSTRIFLAGHSAGATLTLLAVEASNGFRAAASFDASPDQQLLYNGSASKPGNHREIVFDAKDSRELEVRSPLAYVTSLKTPVRQYYSYEASPINERQSERFAELARARGVDAKAARVRGSHMSHVARALPQSIEFFKQQMGRESVQLLHTRSLPARKPNLIGNTTFTLPGHDSARVVSLAGSFNGWDSQHLLCGKLEGRWTCRVDLPAGKYLYQFVVDDEWINDPENPVLEDSGNGGKASVIVIH